MKLVVMIRMKIYSLKFNPIILCSCFSVDDGDGDGDDTQP